MSTDILDNVSERLPENTCIRTLLLKRFLKSLSPSTALSVPVDRSTCSCKRTVSEVITRPQLRTLSVILVTRETDFCLMYVKKENENFRRGTKLENPIRIPRTSGV